MGDTEVRMLIADLNSRRFYQYLSLSPHVIDVLRLADRNHRSSQVGVKGLEGATHGRA
jgi:hypothetical protein